MLRTHFKIKGRNVDTLLFADDQILIAETEDNLQRAIHQLSNITSEYNLQISYEKTKIMAFRATDHLRAKIYINNNPIQQQSDFNYLGYIVSYTSNRDVQNKLNKFQTICGTIKRTFKNCNRQTLLKLYKIMAIPTLLYGCESWVLTISQQNKVEAAEMRFLRQVAGYRLIDKKRNVDIRRELGIQSLNETIIAYRQKWQDHVQRMNEDRTPQIVHKYKPVGRRNVGRPRMRWSDQFP